MAEQNTVFRGPTSQEAFYQDKLRFWGGFNQGTTIAIVLLILLLAGMATFL